MRSARRVPGFLFGLILMAFLPQVATAAPPIDEVRRIGQLMAEATASGNVDAIAGLYAPTALILPPDGSIIARREGIRAVFAANKAAGANKLEFGTVQVDGDDLQAVVVWTWTLTITPAGKAAVKTSGRSMVYLKHFPEGWQIVLDMYQSGQGG